MWHAHVTRTKALPRIHAAHAVYKIASLQQVRIERDLAQGLWCNFYRVKHLEVVPN